MTTYCATFKKSDIDGAVLVECESVEEVKELGITKTAIAKKLLTKIIEFKNSGVPLKILTEVTCHC